VHIVILRLLTECCEFSLKHSSYQIPATTTEYATDVRKSEYTVSQNDWCSRHSLWIWILRILQIV